MSIDIFKDFLSLINSDDRTFLEMLSEIEGILSNPEYSHQRINYLLELEEYLTEETELKYFAIDNPLTSNQIKAILKKGIERAFIENIVTSSQIIKLTHSVDGMRAFTDALTELRSDELADCWKEALSVPFKVVGGIFRRKINFIVADDLDDVRHTFARFINLYKTDIAEGFIDNHLRLLLGDSYDIELIEAKDGVDFEEKLRSCVKNSIKDYNVCFVDEDMPRKRGTDAISSISKELKKSASQRIKFVSYTQKQDLDISEKIARESGADIFLKKTGLSDFYEELVSIFENLVLESSEYKTESFASIDGKIILSVVGVNSDNPEERIKEYLNFRYMNEVWSDEISAGEQNRFWVSPDADDRFSIHVGMYVNTESGVKLIGCARLVTKEEQPQFQLVKNAIEQSDFEISWIHSGRVKNPDEIYIDKFYVNSEYHSPEYTELLSQYALAYSINLGVAKVHIDAVEEIKSVIDDFGFEKSEQYYNLDLSDFQSVVAKRINKILESIKSGEKVFVETLLKTKQD